MNRKIKILFTLGALVILLPATGFPDNWKTVFSIIFGLAVCYVAYLYYQEGSTAAAAGGNKPKAAGTEMFVENGEKAQ